jgi:hypothetical protein
LLLVAAIFSLALLGYLVFLAYRQFALPPAAGAERMLVIREAVMGNDFDQLWDVA